MQDDFGRRIEYLRLSVTDRCNLRCSYCMPEAGIMKKDHEELLRNEEFINIVKVMAILGVNKVRITGGEPLVRRGLSSLIGEIKKIEGIKDITLTTNGILLESQLEDLVEAGITRVNISLDSLNEETFYKLTRGGDLASVIRGIDKAIALGLNPIKINMVLIKGINDHEVDRFLNYFDSSIEVRFIELMPIGEAAAWSKDRFINLNEFLVLKRHDFIPAPNHGNGGPCRYYQHTKTGRYVGIINAISNHFCSDCNRIRVTADGILKTCLLSSAEVDLKPYLNDSEELKSIIIDSIRSKAASHELDQANGVPVLRDMYTIGG